MFLMSSAPLGVSAFPPANSPSALGTVGLTDAIKVGVALGVLDRESFPLSPLDLLAEFQGFDFRRIALDAPDSYLPGQPQAGISERPPAEQPPAGSRLSPLTPAMLGSIGETALQLAHREYALRNLIDGI